MTTLGVVSSSFSRTTRGLATGVVIGGAGLGLILSSGMVSVIQASYRLAGWRYSWFALGLGVLLATILSYALFRADERERAATAARGGDRPALAWSRVYKIALVWYIAVASAFFAFAFAGYSTFFVQFVIGEAGLSKKTAERLWGLVGISSLFSGIVWGWLSDVWGRKPSLIIALLTLTVSIALSAAPHSIPALGLSAMLFGLTMYSTLAIIVAIYGDQIQPGLTQAAIGLTSLVFGMGQVMGAVVPGRLADLTGSFIPAFALATGAALVGMFMSLLLPLPTGPEGWLAVDWD